VADPERLTLPNWVARRVGGEIRDRLGSGPSWGQVLRDPRLLLPKGLALFARRLLPPRPGFRDLEGLPPEVADPLDAIDRERSTQERLRSTRDIVLRWILDGDQISDLGTVAVSSPAQHVDP